MKWFSVVLAAAAAIVTACLLCRKFLCAPQEPMREDFTEE